MKNCLKDYFPSIWTMEEWESCLQTDVKLQKIFRAWSQGQQEEFLDLCTGVQGADMLQSAFFQAVMDPERMQDLLSAVFQKKIQKLDMEEEWQDGQELICLGAGLRLEFEDGKTASVEIWKAGSSFSGQECACHAAQLLARRCQEKKQERGRKFRYRDVGKVCTVVLLKDCHAKMERTPGTYLYTGRAGFEADAESLQDYYLLDLDLYQQESMDKDIQGRLDAWMAFLGCSHPEKIVQLIKTYPCFRGMYEQAYALCRDAQKLIHIFEAEFRHREKDQDRRAMDEMERVIDRLAMQHQEDCEALKLQKIENQQREDTINRQYQEAIHRIEELEKMLG